MSRILGVYHLACINHYMDVFCEQFDMLHASGLYEASKKILIYISMDDNSAALNAKLEEYDPKNKFTIIRCKKNLKERFAINNFREHIENEKHMFYFHSKGVSRNKKHRKQKTRKILDFYTISKWKINLQLLKKYDAVGCFLTRWPVFHFSGNFWWAKIDYVNKLPNCADHYLAPEMFVGEGFDNNFISLANHDQTVDDSHLERTDNDIRKNITDSVICNEDFKKGPYFKRFYGNKQK